jgi:hypothetical protein
MYAEFNNLEDIRQLKRKIETTSKKNSGIKIIGNSTVFFDYDENEKATKKASAAIKAFYKRNKT